MVGGPIAWVLAGLAASCRGSGSAGYRKGEAHAPGRPSSSTRQAGGCASQSRIGACRCPRRRLARRLVAATSSTQRLRVLAYLGGAVAVIVVIALVDCGRAAASVSQRLAHQLARSFWAWRSTSCPGG